MWLMYRWNIKKNDNLLLQDQRQTEAIHLLQAQLTNMTQLVSNLSATVAELKREVIVQLPLL